MRSFKVESTPGVEAGWSTGACYPDGSHVYVTRRRKWWQLWKPKIRLERYEAVDLKVQMPSA